MQKEIKYKYFVNAQLVFVLQFYRDASGVSDVLLIFEKITKSEITFESSHIPRCDITCMYNPFYTGPSRMKCSYINN